MTSKEKIVKIIRNMDSQSDTLDAITLGDIRRITDALIAERIGDVSEWKHRAEVAERALYIAAREVQYLSGNFGAMGEFLAKEKGVPYFIKQAEKELAEEGER